MCCSCSWFSTTKEYRRHCRVRCGYRSIHSTRRGVRWCSKVVSQRITHHIYLYKCILSYLLKIEDTIITVFTHHISLFTHHISLFTHHISLFTHHISLFTHHISLFTHHISLFTQHISLFTHQISVLTHHISLFKDPLIVLS